MRNFLSLLLALVMVMSFSIVAFAGNGDGTGGGDGSQNEYDAEVDGPGSLTFKGLASSNSFSIDKVSIPFEMDSNPTGGLKHADSSNMSETLNSSTVTLSCNGAAVSGFKFTLSNIYCINSDKHRAGFNIDIDSSLLSVGSTYTLTIKAGATWSNKPKNTATLASDFSYTFTVVEEEVEVETTSEASKQKSPLVKDEKKVTTTEETTTVVIEETTIEAETTTEAVTDVATEAPSEVAYVDYGDDSALVVSYGVSGVGLAVLCILRKKLIF